MSLRSSWARARRGRAAGTRRRRSVRAGLSTARRRRRSRRRPSSAPSSGTAAGARAGRATGPRRPLRCARATHPRRLLVRGGDRPGAPRAPWYRTASRARWRRALRPTPGRSAHGMPRTPTRERQPERPRRAGTARTRCPARGPRGRRDARRDLGASVTGVPGRCASASASRATANVMHRRSASRCPSRAAAAGRPASPPRKCTADGWSGQEVPRPPRAVDRASVAPVLRRRRVRQSRSRYPVATRAARAGADSTALRARERTTDGRRAADPGTTRAPAGQG